MRKEVRDAIRELCERTKDILGSFIKLWLFTNNNWGKKRPF